jgi:hypothetical protein
MAAAQLRTILNGPVVAGVGATVDAGLPSDKFHVLPWNPDKKIIAKLVETAEGLEVKTKNGSSWYTGDIKEILKYAIWNVNNILSIENILVKAASASEEFKENLRSDVIAIVFLQMCYGYYANECRATKGNEAAQISKIEISDATQADIVSVSRLNRAATFILARMHTKYQTNHAIGGTPMQASMASSVRAFYSVSPSSARSAQATAQVTAIADCIYWAVHPANETLLIPAVIQNSMIDSSLVHAHGPEPTMMAVEEYFQIRARTPPASTHHFYVAAAAIKQLEPLGILPYLPEPNRTTDIVSGLRMIASHGAKLHPAARFWGLDRLSANQKLVETICSDLGYAVKKLMPASSLAASPILQKEDGLDAAWKGLIDAIRAAMDERGKELLDSKVFEEIRKAIAPTSKELKGLSEIKGYLTSGKVEDEEDDEEDSSDEEEETVEKGKEKE